MGSLEAHGNVALPTRPKQKNKIFSDEKILSIFVGDSDSIFAFNLINSITKILRQFIYSLLYTNEWKNRKQFSNFNRRIL